MHQEQLLNKFLYRHQFQQRFLLRECRDHFRAEGRPLPESTGASCPHIGGSAWPLGLIVAGVCVVGALANAAAETETPEPEGVGAEGTKPQALCHDGTIWFGATSKGACRGRRGVHKWLD